MTLHLLAFSAPFGSGHLQAARSIAGAFEEYLPDAAAETVNISTGLLDSMAAGYLMLINRAPAAYRTLYHSPVGAGLRQFVRAALSSPVRTQLARMKPDLVVATHPFPALVLGDLRRRGLLSVPVGIVTTDFLPHQLWVSTGVDRYFVASEAAASRLGQLGVDPGRICVSGIPVSLLCGDEANRGSRTADVRRVLVMGGGLGLGPIVQAVASLLGQPHANLEVTVVCGQNEGLRQGLEDNFGSDPRITVLGFSPIVPALMHRAHLLVTKPGGLTCSEALACQLPMLLLQPLPGHEEENAEHLCQMGVACVTEAEQAGETATQLLFENPARLAFMQATARLYGRPQAAVSIALEMAGLVARPASAIA